MKPIREYAAARSLSADVVLNPKGKHVATVRAHFADSGRVVVEVCHTDGETKTQRASAGGYGYDKFHSALAGLTIDGHTMADHSDGYNLPDAVTRLALDGVWTRAIAERLPKGYHCANYNEAKGGYTSCIRS